MKTVALWISVLSVMLGGCASSKDAVFGHEMSSMKTIHDQKFGHTQAPDKTALAARAVGHGDRDLAGRAKERYRALSLTFPVLHNPVIVTYVYPHLTQAGTPIPGYVTYFKLYHTDHIALPGEVPEDVIAKRAP